ncbi:DUF6931 family protein [Prosthecomicrobium sp. N25]|uniref:DUF6931 family protein n=1 Tax=Prosthecomicrobium sp. N25 TaxID=3129254 RepID=UPI0030782776
MSRVRFVSVEDVFLAFEPAAADVGESGSAEDPVAFLAGLLAADKPLAALRFVSYVLPRRECVWWCVQSVRRMAAPPPGSRDETALIVAEDWVRDPSEAPRRRALEIGLASGPVGACQMAALAAGWSGGNKVLDDDKPVPAEPFATARIAQGAVLTAIARHPPEKQFGLMAVCAEAGRRFAAGEPLTFSSPAPST